MGYGLNRSPLNNGGAREVDLQSLYL